MEKTALFVSLMSFACSSGPKAVPHHKNQESFSPPPMIWQVQDKKTKSPKLLAPLVNFRSTLHAVKIKMLLRGSGLIKVEQDGRVWMGTGLCVTRKLILTAAHLPYNEDKGTVNEDGEFITWKLQDNGTFLEEDRRVKIKLKKYEYSGSTDLALYFIDDPTFNCRPIPISEREPSLGDVVYRFGFNRGWLYTQGVYFGTYNISENGKLTEWDFYAMPNGPGASGGPIVNSSGELVSVAVMHMWEEEIDLNKRDELFIKMENYVLAVRLPIIRKFLETPAK